MHESYTNKYYDFLLINTFMPPDPDDGNDLMTLSRSKIRYNEKRIEIFVFQKYFRRYIEKMAGDSKK